MSKTTGPNTGTWIAESVPMYEITGKNVPTTDEGFGMTARQEFGRGLSYTDALEVIAGKLTELAAPEYSRSDHTGEFHRAAAALFLSAADTVGGYMPLDFGLQIHGRFWRIRNITA